MPHVMVKKEDDKSCTSTHQFRGNLGKQRDALFCFSQAGISTVLVVLGHEYKHKDIK